MIPWLPVRRLFTVINGGTPTPDERNWDGDIAWLTPEDLSGADGGVLTSSRRTLTKIGIATSNAVVSPAGALVVSTRAPIGYVAELGMAAATNQGCRALVPRADVDVRFFRYALLALRSQLQVMGQGSTFQELSAGDLAGFALPVPDRKAQTRIADYLDRETSRIDEVTKKKERMAVLAQESANAMLLGAIGERSGSAWVPLRRVLTKLERPATGEIVTAFRDGHVMLRSRRRDDGFTESDSQYGYQGVRRGDVVFHGLDGFAGAVGVSEDDGMCTPVYHVCAAAPGIDAQYVAMALRAQALSGYLMLQAGNVRERAVDFRNWKRLADITIPIPTDHRAVAEAYRARRNWAELAVGAIRRQLGLIQERRRALIAHAVTGRIGITGAV